jgi:antitoxin component YwqK of YwqJK toxin-antitoxin module
MKKTYCFDGKNLTIFDEELSIAIQEPFNPRVLPPFEDLQNNPQVVIEKSFVDQELSAGFRSERGLDGQWRSFTMDGRLKSQCYYLEGALHGPSQFYALSGQCLSQSWFYRGFQHGRAERYHRSGGLAALEHYIKGKREKAQLYYYPNGQMKTKMVYRNGRLEGEADLFWPNGQQKRRCFFLSGEREGFDRIWSAAGALLNEEEYQKGIPVGCHSSWYENGSLRSKRVYHTSDRFDLYEWDSNGNPLYEGIFDLDLCYLEKSWKEGNLHTRRGQWIDHSILWEPCETT